MNPNDIQIVAASARTPVGLAARTSPRLFAPASVGFGCRARPRSTTGPSGSSRWTACWIRARSAVRRGSRRWAGGARRRTEERGAAGPEIRWGDCGPGRVARRAARMGSASIDRVRTTLAAVDVPQVRLRVEARAQGHAAALALVRGGAAVATRRSNQGRDRRRCRQLPRSGDARLVAGEPAVAGRRLAFGVRARRGSSFVALMRDEDARRLEVPEGPEVLGVGIASEARLIKSDDTCLGEGLTAAVGRAIASLQSPTEIVDDVHCDINGERYRAEEWGFVALRLGDAFRDATVYKTPVQGCGDLGAATGAVNLIRCTQAWRRGYAKGPRALAWGSSEGGCGRRSCSARRRRVADGKRLDQSAEDAGHQGQLQRRRGHAPQRMQDAGSSRAVRPDPAAQHRQERQLAAGLLEVGRHRRPARRHRRRQLRQHRRHRQSGDRAAA